MVNVGFILGTASGMLDVDLDCQEAVDLADEYLPSTNSIFGRASASSSHRLYRCVAGDARQESRGRRSADGSWREAYRAGLVGPVRDTAKRRSDIRSIAPALPAPASTRRVKLAGNADATLTSGAL
jgi:hypothetical protein